MKTLFFVISMLSFSSLYAQMEGVKKENTKSETVKRHNAEKQKIITEQRKLKPKASFTKLQSNERKNKNTRAENKNRVKNTDKKTLKK